MKKDKKQENENVIFVDGPEEASDYNENLQQEYAQRRKWLMILSLVVIVVVIIGIYFTVNQEYKGYRIVKTNNTNYENTATYIRFGENLLKYTPDGASYINENGDTVWSAGINMSSPVAESSGGYAVIADIGGNEVCVFNGEGQVSSLTMPYLICDVDIGKQGAFAVVLESDETNYINMYDKNGKIIYERKSTINKSGYPLDITISEDAEKLFTSYISVGKNGVENNLAAYNFGDVGQNSNADRMVGGYKCEEEIVPKVQFINNDTVVAFGTKDITVYAMKEKPSVKGKISLQQEIESVFFASSYIGYVEKVGKVSNFGTNTDAQKQKNNDVESEHLYRIKVYNEKTNLLFEDYIDFRFTKITATDNEIIITGDNNCLIFRKNGKVKYNGVLSGDIQSMVPSGKNLEYIVVYNNMTEIIKLKSSSAVESVSTELLEVPEEK